MKRLIAVCILILFMPAALGACTRGAVLPPPEITPDDRSEVVTEESPAVNPDEVALMPEITCEDSSAPRPVLPDGFSYIGDINPNIRVELRYAGEFNFTGAIVDGYYSDTAAILRTEAAEALSRVQEELEKDGYGLLVYDAYRPVKAVQCFVQWSKSEDERTKAEFYPDLNKSDLFNLGYISSNSAHSRGSTIDLTILTLYDEKPLDMGGPFDFFGDVSHHGAAGLTAEQNSNRTLLKNTMEKYGFSSYANEWWHYTFPVTDDTAFDFDVR